MLALSSRVVIEQAKGMLSERHALPMDEAFTLLRGHARSSRQNLTDLAQSVVTRNTDLPPPGSGHRPPAPPGEHPPGS